MKISGYSIEELVEKLNIKEKTVSYRITMKNIKPKFKGAIYSFDTLKILKDFKEVGRPKKKEKTRHLTTRPLFN